MHDIRWIRDNPDAFDAALMRRDPGLEGTAERLTGLDDKRREVTTRLQAMQERRNAASKEIGQAKKAGDEQRAQALMEEVAGIKEKMAEDEAAQREAEAALNDALSWVPNLPLDDVPDGTDESANRLEREVGSPPRFDFEAKQHFEIGEALGLMDFEAAAKLSGSRFVALKGALARLERALAAFMLDLHTAEHGYEEVNPPLLVRDEAMFGTGQLPKFEEDQFETKNVTFRAEFEEFEFKKENISLDNISFYDEARQAAFREAVRRRARVNMQMISGAGPALQVVVPLWLIPTAEVPLTNLVRDDIIDEDSLPRRYTAGTYCFRAEAGAAGKDTRGMIRQHQFYKVELVSVTAPEDSLAELDRMTACAEEVLKRLELPYRVMTLSTGDMGFAARKTYDIEVWLPGQNAYREISSCSVCGDFQARRMGARYRPEGEKQPRYVHTLNGSGVAVGRALIAILENYQRADGSVVVPEALRPYMGGRDVIGA